LEGVGPDPKAASPRKPLAELPQVLGGKERVWIFWIGF
jgi:hypothetical protein